jgi:hypothetical protein
LLLWNSLFISISTTCIKQFFIYFFSKLFFFFCLLGLSFASLIRMTLPSELIRISEGLLHDSKQVGILVWFS